MIELIAFASHRPNDVILETGKTEMIAGPFDGLAERRIADHNRWPDFVEKLVFAHHAIAVKDQVSEQIEHFGLHVHRFAVKTKLPPTRIEFSVANEENGDTPCLIAVKDNAVAHAPTGPPNLKFQCRLWRLLRAMRSG